MRALEAQSAVRASGGSPLTTRRTRVWVCLCGRASRVTVARWSCPNKCQCRPALLLSLAGCVDTQARRVGWSSSESGCGLRLPVAGPGRPVASAGASLSARQQAQAAASACGRLYGPAFSWPAGAPRPAAPAWGFRCPCPSCGHRAHHEPGPRGPRPGCRPPADSRAQNRPASGPPGGTSGSADVARLRACQPGCKRQPLAPTADSARP